MPYGLTAQNKDLVAADTANSRLVGFDARNLAIGVAAPRLAGPCVTSRGDNRRNPPARDSLWWPCGVAACEDTLVVAETGNNRVLVPEAAP